MDARAKCRAWYQRAKQAHPKAFRLRAHLWYAAVLAPLWWGFSWLHDNIDAVLLYCDANIHVIDCVYWVKLMGIGD